MDQLFQANGYFLMEQFMKEILKIISQMEKAYSFFLLLFINKENGTLKMEIY